MPKIKKKMPLGEAAMLSQIGPVFRNNLHCDVCDTPITSEELDQFFDLLDKSYQAVIAKFTAGISPAALATAYFSWLSQLALCPGRILELALYPAFHAQDCTTKILCHLRPGDGRDVRFHTDSWQSWPWEIYAENFLQFEDWWRRATTGIPGVPSHVERTVSFCARQIIDALSPSNFVLTNPDLFQETISTLGLNLFHGTKLAIQDRLERIFDIPPEGVENFVPGEHVAITPGKVVFRNHLIELIQYEATTKTVYKEPVLILPAWIMKYYILDLSPHNSLVKWLVSQGHTVFIVSWRNPRGKDRHLGLDDYHRLGAMAAINAVSKRIPNTKINLMGYCLGGTLALISAAFMAREGDERLNTLSLLAAQGDFSEAGELMLFITESEITFLKNMMWEKGYLDTKQMAGSFQMLRSYDLIWSKMVHDYMSGRQRGLIDLLAWNADATRMPYKMHSEYLEKLFLNNDFAAGRFAIEGKHIVAENIHLPTFAVSTEKDHVAPWRSVYKIHLMMNNDITFVLTSGGHNAGIVSEPGHKGRSYHIRERKKDSNFIDADHWVKMAEKRKGSWWVAWHEWLIKHSSEKRVRPPKLDSSLPSAPGTYVLQK
ncbi:PHA synthase [Legionella jamestowniensis]|uniref:PHA synthase n=2 Tax=Legionella jamestowniensis TaxID=455 RepID=A0A0W0UIV2_9GAMM|nr:alpha/beta fold hydrolase [Legionella jamestowniensis]KTD07796.1 polyhydroxyalkanoic synthase [Legionella jamestowniensis]OCH99528.1 PHA synthase [Legionella jamestowniensis]SFL62302.1 polyhydroxyalkanoate synthase [Legionella jamestowniensis DSM 19215]